MCNATIRGYERGDREAVFSIAADTAFFGEPVEHYLDDRRLFCDALYRYYTDLEPEHARVAATGNALAGFLVGCVDTRTQRRLWVRQILPRLAAGMLSGRYVLGRRTWRHAGRALRASLTSRAKIDLARYPAHFHLNVLADWRGQGIGRRLLQAFLSQLRKSGVPGVHLNTTTRNVAAGRLYESMGFVPLDIRPAPQWSDLIHDDVRSVTYALDLRER